MKKFASLALLLGLFVVAGCGSKTTAVKKDAEVSTQQEEQKKNGKEDYTLALD